jgi:serine phosphatase RsbU (regulator of sigma subunit)/tetratricopeptide (TPR) repeat protein
MFEDPSDNAPRPIDRTNLRLEADRLNNEAWAMRSDNDREAFRVAGQAYRSAQSAQYAEGIRLALRTMAVTALETGIHAEAFEHATVAAELFREAGEESQEALMQNVLGGVYYYLGDHHGRLQCNLRGLVLCRRSNDRTGLLRALNNTADTYTRLGDLDKAMSMFEECLSLADDSTPFIQCIVLSNMGEVHLLQGLSKDAEDLIHRSQEIGKRINYDEIVVNNLIMLAQMALTDQNPNKAILLLTEAQNSVNEHIALNDRANIHRHLAEAHEKLGDHREAYLNHRQFHDLSQQHLDEQKVKEVRSIEFKQEIHTLQHAAARLEKLIDERTQQLENSLADLRQRDHERQQDLEVEQAVNQFSQSLFQQKTVEEVLWDLSKSCIARLGFVDSVIYLVNEAGTELIQKAAYGPKNPIDLDILNPITIPMGRGIVGSVAQSGTFELIHDTSLDSRYIVDDEMRLSEIAVPIISNRKVIGVIDSEHPDRGFFNSKHLRVLQTIASLVANRIERIREQEERERLQSELIDQLKKNEQLQTQVTRELEVKVLERTREIESARERIERQALDIRDSISYARSIQNALLPSADEVKRLFERNFILYLPRDVVSGDFYWVARKGNRHYLAVADCTGHGVPGALVSVLCVEKLEQALLLADDPSMILRIVNDEVKRTLRQSIGEAISTSRDGMDVALMAFDTDTGMLSFAGAKRPLWLIRDSEVIILQSTRFSIGGHSRDGQQFEEQRMKVRPGDTVYLFSDGYADQFGGAEGRKFTSARFRESLLNISLHAMSSQQQELSRILSEWKEKEEQVDDVLVVGVRF